MAPLQRPLRKQLDRVIGDARLASEYASRRALDVLGVAETKVGSALSESDRALRRALRARERQLGGFGAIVSEVAYQHWHRMLFARFLAENDLLIHPEHQVAVTLDTVRELARATGEEPWPLAARYAMEMLPAIFRRDDPELQVRFAPEDQKALDKLLESLPKEVFTSDDGLGWVYQFWQSKEKNRIGTTAPVGADELPAVTQLFTEDYMVRFLLENSLGAWWAGRHPESPLVAKFSYLRKSATGAPVAGGFDGWPDSVRDVSVLDPCCGSGHFLTVAFEMLADMRAEEEGIGATDAADAVIAENLFGLELDPRCAQIAAFALALAAWRYGGGYRRLPSPSIACSGIGVRGQLADWQKLAKGDPGLVAALTELHDQFRDAPDLGSLIDPRSVVGKGTLFQADPQEVAQLLDQLLERERDEEMRVAGWAAAGIARAAHLLSRTYTLVATNPPFLGVQRMQETLSGFIKAKYPAAKHDLAVAFQKRALRWLEGHGAYAYVTPQTLLDLYGIRKFRQEIVTQHTPRLLAPLGSGAFGEISGDVVMVALLVVEGGSTDSAEYALLLDAELCPLEEKGPALQTGQVSAVSLESVRLDPDFLLAVADREQTALLGVRATSWHGLVTSDNPRYLVRFWEVPALGKTWVRYMTAPRQTLEYEGRTSYLRWEGGTGALSRSKATNFNPSSVLGASGVLIAAVSSLRATLYTGEMFDGATVPVLPNKASDLPALWAFCSSPDFASEVRKIIKKASVSKGYLLKVPFNLDHWTVEAKSRYPVGLPEPSSNDPTQWLFKGHPVGSTAPLHVGVARLLGYRWPDQPPDLLDDLADADGVVVIPGLLGEPPAAERLRALLERAWGKGWSQGVLERLLLDADAGTDLEAWLRNKFFAAHAKLFLNRPFIWHIWDGQPKGFAALVNCHRLDRRLLDRITHLLLGAWIDLQRYEAGRGTAGAQSRLDAAEDLQRRLEDIAEGEAPLDIFVRWKAVSDLPVGWDPDLDDGVRMNIRPFVRAGVLRAKVAIHWRPDGKKQDDGSKRSNDLSVSLAEKIAART